MAQHRHKRETNARCPKAIQVAGSIAVMATVSAVSLGVLSASPQDSRDLVAAPLSSLSSVPTADSGKPVRADIVSRSAARTPVVKLSKRIATKSTKQADDRAQRKAELAAKQATLRAVTTADVVRWTTTELNLWSGPEADAAELGVIDGSKKVLVTGRAANGRVEVVVNDRSRWVTAGYLAEEKPAPESTEATLGGACTNGSSVAGQPNIIEVHRAVCAAFPDLTSYGTYRGDGEHAQGRAIDIMVSGEYGWQVAEFLRSNYSALGISYMIFSQKIWSVERGGEGWRSMSDRGSTTANHYDHVHVTTY